MKTFYALLGMLSLLALPGRAQALLEDSHIQSIVRLDAEACAVELKILDHDLGILEPLDGLLGVLNLDRVKIDDDLLSDLTDLLDLDLTNDDSILIASPAFEALADISADIRIDNDDCLKIQANAHVDLVSGLDLLDAVVLPGSFGDLKAFVFNSVKGIFELIDLELLLVDVGNSSDGSVSVGGGGSPGTENPEVTGEGNGAGTGDGSGPPTGQFATGGGCALGSSEAPFGSLFSLILMAMSCLALKAGWGPRRKASMLSRR